MKNHVIICGYGRNGQQVAAELTANKNQFVIIEKDISQIQNNTLKSSKFLEGDATNDETLLLANIDKAKALITTLPVDADNLYIALTARTLNPTVEIISRAIDENSEKKLKRAGVNNVVMPEKVGGTHMANLVAKPDIIEFLEHISIHGSDDTKLEEISCSDLSEKLNNKTINEMNIRSRSGVNIIGFKTVAGQYILNPSPETKILDGTKLFILGTQSQIENFKKLLN